MELIRFVFWEGAKVLGLVCLGLVSSKAVASLTVRNGGIKVPLYALILGLAGLGAWYAGNDVAAQVYMLSSDSSLAQGDPVRAYANAVHAVSLRPNNLSYWHSLMHAKIHSNQLQSALDDEPAVRALSKATWTRGRIPVCALLLLSGPVRQSGGHNPRLIRENPSYAAPYVLQGPCLHGGEKISRGAAELPGGASDFPQQSSRCGGSGARLLSGRRSAAGAGRAR